jgi:glycosyltransferase involved in cell wall biosynthesis
MHFTIVSYAFPPSKDIGGRRWAKFSQQISKFGHTVSVICAQNGEKEIDYYFGNIKVTVLPKCYPAWLKGFTKSFREKLLYRIYTRVLSPLTKQNFFDEGYAWGSVLLTALENVHKREKIDILIATGAPFSIFSYASIFKSRHQEVKFVADLRDPWTWGSYYGIPKLASAKKRFQEESEYSTIAACDMFTYPTENMGNFLKSKYPNFLSKFQLLPHAYDPEKFLRLNEFGKRKGFVYGGTLYDGIDEYIKKLAKIVQSNKQIDFHWDIFTNSPSPILKKGFDNVSIRVHNFVPEEELFLKIRGAAAYLAFFPPADKDLISTKFFEIIYSETPILYIGEEGEIAKFVRENKLGVHILPTMMEEELPKYLSGNVPFEKGYFDVSRYTFKSVTQNFLSNLTALNAANRN